MKIAIIGSGRIGANIGLRAAEARHDVAFSFSRSTEKLAMLAERGGQSASAMSVRDAIEMADVVVVSVPWNLRSEAVGDPRALQGKIVVDTTNQYGGDGIVSLSHPAVVENMALFPGARFAKAFNTFTAQFQIDEKDRLGDDRHAMFFASEDTDAAAAACTLIEAVGFDPVRLGGWDVVELLEAPRRSGSVYGEAYRPENARRIAAVAATDAASASRLADELKEAE